MTDKPNFLHCTADLQEVTLTGLMWDRVTAGMQSLAALPHVRKLTLIDNELQHLHQVTTAHTHHCLPAHVVHGRSCTPSVSF